MCCRGVRCYYYYYYYYDYYHYYHYYYYILFQKQDEDTDNDATEQQACLGRQADGRVELTGKQEGRPTSTIAESLCDTTEDLRK